MSSKGYLTSKWREIFEKSNGQLEVGLDTYLILGNHRDYYFEFEGTPIRWCNGSSRVAAVVIVPIKNPNDYSKEQALLRRFLSQLSYHHHIGISELSEIASGRLRPKPFLRQPHHFGGLIVVEPRFQELTNLLPKQKLALALYREALSAGNTNYSLLVKYKIIQLASERRHADRWIEERLIPSALYKAREWLNQLPSNRTPGEHIRKAFRHAIAHVEEVLDTGDKTIDPDDLVQRDQVQATNEIVGELAKIAVREILST